MIRARDMYKEKIQKGEIQVPPNDLDVSQTSDYRKSVAWLPPQMVAASPGVMICQLCGEAIDPEKDWSDDPQRRFYQQKFHIHNRCDEAKERVLDTVSNEDPNRHTRVVQKPEPKKVDSVRF